MKIIIVLLNLICFIKIKCGTGIEDFDISNTMIYYDPRSRLPFRITTIENNLSNSTLGSIQSTKLGSEVVLRKVGFRSNGCTCQEFTCGCCAGFNFQQFNFNREGCMNFTYDAFEFSINLDMYMNENSIYSNSVSAKNPPPICMPVPIPYLPSVDFCAKIFDIYTRGQNLHMCLDFETRVQQATVLVLHFNCMKMGVNGVSLVKPGEGLGESPNAPDTQINPDKYDEVTEIKIKKIA